MNAKVIRLCPKCGKATIDEEMLTDTCSCRACGWSGKTSQTVVSDIIELPIDPFEMFLKDFRNTLVKECGVTIGRVLVKYGFLPNSPDVKDYAMYLNAIAKSSAIAVLQTRDKLAKES